MNLRTDFSCAAASYDEAAVLARETNDRLAARLDYVKIAPRRIADVGCATGDGIRELQRRYPAALPLAVDYARPMLAAVKARTPLLARIAGRAPRALNADVRKLPLADASLGLIWSNLMLHWLDEPLPAFREFFRVLEVGGLLTFALLGPDTLKELRAAGASGLPKFPDMHDIGDMLVAAGFADPVMEMEMIELAYARPRGLLRDQRLLGVRDAFFGGMDFRAARQVFRAWAQQRGDVRLPASFEIVYGHAWKPEPRAADDGRAVIRFARQ